MPFYQFSPSLLIYLFVFFWACVGMLIGKHAPDEGKGFTFGFGFWRKFTRGGLYEPFERPWDCKIDPTMVNGLRAQKNTVGSAF
uniref:Uncharacterized protein n=1 Tax=Rhizophora mucronata TaxID=61149 RepID=A0A2P2QLQ3_RHIMU